MTEAPYGFEKEPIASGGKTVNATKRTEERVESFELKERVEILEKEIEDLKKAVDQLLVVVFQQR